MSRRREYPPLERGVLTVSIDLELAWGFCDQRLGERRLAAIRRERELLPRLVELFTRHDMRATWAIVGHLLLARAPRDGAGRAHPSFPRPSRRGERRDHFFQLPTGERDPVWWGADLVDRVRRARPRQEIGSHSFSHLLYEEGRTLEAAVAADLEAARRVHAEHELDFDSFVFPRNVVGFHHLLERNGVRVYREVTSRWYTALRPVPLRRAARLAMYLMGLTPPSVKPTWRGGLIAVGDSLLLIGREGLRAWVPGKRLVKMAHAGMERAAERREVFHLWLHPSNLVAREPRQFAVLDEILAHGRRLVEDGRLENWVMADFATYASRETAGSTA